ncbi:PEBP-like protein, partial [Basidiobolus meristosporus CBS 931.73]
GKEVDQGNELLISETQTQPQVSFDGLSDKLYTLIMADPDVPSRANPTLREFRHWVVGNIHSDDIDKGDIVTSYMGPATPPKTGYHRYQFMLYEQPGPINYEKLPEEKSQRLHFNSEAFVKENQLELVASNYFVAENK